jgi:RNA polymerase sigma factor (sigma-70 family)
MYEDVVQRAMEHALRRVGRAEALEVAHDVACDLVRRRLAGDDDPEAGSLDGLVFRAVSNRLHNVQRSANRRAAADRIHHDEQARTVRGWAIADASVDHDELSRVVAAAVADMPEVMRRVFLLVRRDGLSYRDAAARLGIGIGTIHTHLARANVRLRDAVARYETGTGAVATNPSVAVRHP